MLGELTEAQVINLLSSQNVGRLGYTDGQQPYIIPVTYVYDGQYIYIQSNEGSKLSSLRRHPAVCFEVDIMTDMGNWQSVLVLGTFHELAGEKAYEARSLLFDRVFTLMTNNSIHTHEHAAEGDLPDFNRVKQIMYRIQIQQVTGRFERN